MEMRQVIAQKCASTLHHPAMLIMFSFFTWVLMSFSCVFMHFLNFPILHIISITVNKFVLEEHFLAYIIHLIASTLVQSGYNLVDNLNILYKYAWIYT